MTYEMFVESLIKSGEEILKETTPHKACLIHMTMGIAGEAGELLDAIKKHTMYNKPLDFENVIEELGDLEFYLEGLRQELGLTRDSTIDANTAKLMKRYPSNMFTNQHAQERLDKDGE